MSRVETVMDGVLAQLADGILTSPNQLRGYLPHDLIQQAQQFPHVQAFNPITATEEDVFRQAPETLAFQLEILDAPGRADANRIVLEALARELQTDPAYANSLGADRIQVELRGLQERTPREMTVAGARVLVEFPAYGRTAGEVDLFTMPGNASLFESRNGPTEIVTDSDLIPGGIGLERSTISGTNVLRFNETVFPLDLSGVKRIRMLYYVRHSNARDAGGLTTARLTLDSSGQESHYDTTSVGSGWQEQLITLADFDAGPGADLSAITQVEWTRTVSDSTLVHDEEGMILARLYHQPADLADVPAIVPASREVEAMQFVLDALEQSNYGSTRQRGYLDPIHIQQSSGLPFVQVFQPETADEAASFGDRPSTLSFVVQIIDVPGNADAVRDALENLAQSLREDPEVGRTFRITAHSVDERPDRETVLGAATIEVEWRDEVLDGNGVDIVDLVGNASLVTSLDTIVDSEVIEGGVGQIKGTLFQSELKMELKDPFPEFPINLRFVQTLRLLIYLRESSVVDDVIYGNGGATKITIAIAGTGGAATWDRFDVGTGWIHVELFLDIGNPLSPTTGDLTTRNAVNTISITRQLSVANNQPQNEESMIWQRVYFRGFSDSLPIGRQFFPVVIGTEGSRAEIVMQAVLDHVADVVLSGVEEFRPIKFREFRRPESLEGLGPFVMVYSGITDTAQDTFGERPPSLDFTLDIVDAPGRGDVMRETFQQLAADLRQNPGLAGDALRARVAVRTVSEKATRERTFGRATISLDWNASDTNPQETELLALEGNASFIFAPSGLATNSEIILGGIAYAKIAFAANVQMIFTNAFPEFPIDLSGTKFLRVVFFLRENFVLDGGVLLQFTFRLNDTSNNQNIYFIPSTARGIGWHELVVDLANPASGIADLSLVDNWRLFFATDTFSLSDPGEAIIVKRFYFTERDTGSLPNGRSF